MAIQALTPRTGPERIASLTKDLYSAVGEKHSTCIIPHRSVTFPSSLTAPFHHLFGVYHIQMGRAHFLCCLPARLGVVIFSFCDFALSGIIAGSLWAVLIRNHESAS